MPTTRARAAKIKPVKSFDSDDERKNENMGASSSSDDPSISTSVKPKIPSQITHAKSGAAVSDSEDDMNLEEMRIRDLENKVKDQEKMIEGLTNKNIKLHKRIKKFERKELQDELKDLTQKLPEDSNEERDPLNRMRKYLRNFSGLMSLTTIDDESECPICYNKLKIKQCSAFKCQHIVCNECLLKLPRGDAKQIGCAECREFTLRDNIESIEMTEVQRWDQLLDIAREWASFDSNEEASDEEAEENFINDEMETPGILTGANEDKDKDDDDGHVASQEASPSIDDNPPTPSSSSRSFFDFSSKEKRKRVEQLAKELSNKRRT